MNAGRLQEVFIELMKDVGTNITGHLLAFDATTQLAQVQIGILAKDDNGNDIKPAPIIECPVHFSGGSEWMVEHQIDPKDEGLIVFSQRCLDGWIQTGGIANNPIARFHDKQDACFVPGFRSKSNAISNFQNNGVRLRNKDATVYHWLKNDSSIESVNSMGHIKLLASGVVDINGFLIQPVTGAASSPTSVSSPSVIAATSLTVAGKEQKEHVHERGTYKVGSSEVTGQSGVQS